MFSSGYSHATAISAQKLRTLLSLGSLASHAHLSKVVVQHIFDILKLILVVSVDVVSCALGNWTVVVIRRNVDLSRAKKVRKRIEWVGLVVDFWAAGLARRIYLREGVVRSRSRSEAWHRHWRNKKNSNFIREYARHPPQGSLASLAHLEIALSSAVDTRPETIRSTTVCHVQIERHVDVEHLLQSCCDGC